MSLFWRVKNWLQAEANIEPQLKSTFSWVIEAIRSSTLVAQVLLFAWATSPFESLVLQSKTRLLRACHSLSLVYGRTMGSTRGAEPRRHPTDHWTHDTVPTSFCVGVVLLNPDHSSIGQASYLKTRSIASSLVFRSAYPKTREVAVQRAWYSTVYADVLQVLFSSASGLLSHRLWKVEQALIT